MSLPFFRIIENIDKLWILVYIQLNMSDVEYDFKYEFWIAIDSQLVRYQLAERA